MVEAPGRTETARALIQFHASPDNARLAAREPAQLFAAVDEIIHLAMRREDTAAKIRDAARFFIYSAMLRPDADPYTLLGLERSATADEVKKRYRLLVRLLHPDVADGCQEWGSDAAVRVNLAYEALSSPLRRREYEQKVTTPAHPTSVLCPSLVCLLRLCRCVSNFRGPVARFAIVGSFLFALVMMALLFVTNDAADSTLVQRMPEERKPVAMQSAFDAVVNAAQNLSESVSRATTFRTSPAPAPAARPGPTPEPPPPATAAELPRPTEFALAEPARAQPELLAPNVTASMHDINVPIGPQVMPAVASTPPPRAPAQEPVALVAAAVPAVPAPLVTEAQPLLVQLLQQLQTGNGNELLQLLEPATRDADAQALAREYTQLTHGKRPQIVGVQFKGEPRTGRLLVRGTIKINVDDAQPFREFVLNAEFVHRDGAVALRRLSLAN